MFRAEGHRNYKPCGDQFLRNFIRELTPGGVNLFNRCSRRKSKRGYLMFNKYKLIPFFIALLVILPVLSSLLGFYTDWLFFVETGFSSVFTTTLYAKTGAGLFFGLFLLVFVLINLFLANRAKFPHTGMFIVGGGNFR